MAKFEYTHNNHIYTIEADNEAAADKKFDETLKLLEQTKVGERARKEEQENKNWDEKFAKASTPYGKLNSGMNAIFGRANRVLNNIPGVEFTTKFLSPSAIKGIPGARHYVPQTEYLTEQEKEHPYIAKGMQIAGGTGATLPLSGLAAINAAKAGVGFLPQFMGQTAVNTALNTGDTLAEKGLDLNKSDFTNDLMWGAGQSILPSAFTRGIGQSARIPSRVNNEFSRFMSPGGSTLPSGAIRPTPWNAAFRPHTSPPLHGALEGMSREQIDALATSLGAVTGYSTHGLEGLLAGGFGGHFATPLINSLMHSSAGEAVGRTMRNPSTQDIIRALAAQGKVQMTSPSTTLGE